jgi:hypothetical protein
VDKHRKIPILLNAVLIRNYVHYVDSKTNIYNYGISRAWPHRSFSVYGKELFKLDYTVRF